jgi:O-antigen/teichoic acid export membrane protein
MLFKKQKQKIMLASLLSIGISLLLNYVLVNRLGAYGAALAMAIVQVVVLAITVFFVKAELAKLWWPKQQNVA